MNILLVGGTGYLGNKLIKQLEIENHDVLCITRNNNSPNIKKYLCIYDKDLY
ncbi:NAD-dependent epimerase/dehydratase family protein, partial [Brachyspira hyodysenteriae]